MPGGRTLPSPSRTARPSANHWTANLNLQLAWQRVKLDRPHRTFVARPHLISWIESDLDSWIQSLADKLRAGYTPHDCVTCYEPKGNWMVRPGAVLDINDEIVLNSALGSFHQQIWSGIGWSQGDPDIAYQFQRSTTRPEWIRSGCRFGASGEEGLLAS
jgi:hypothetical protein